MSKAVRIREHLYEEIERLAKSERRSIIGQLEMLLEQALAMESAARGFAREAPVTGEPRTDVDDLPDVKATVRVIPTSEADDHFKPDPKPVRK